MLSKIAQLVDSGKKKYNHIIIYSYVQFCKSYSIENLNYLHKSTSFNSITLDGKSYSDPSMFSDKNCLGVDMYVDEIWLHKMSRD